MNLWPQFWLFLCLSLSLTLSLRLYQSPYCYNIHLSFLISFSFSNFQRIFFGNHFHFSLSLFISIIQSFLLSLSFSPSLYVSLSLSQYYSVSIILKVYIFPILKVTSFDSTLTPFTNKLPFFSSLLYSTVQPFVIFPTVI